MKSIILTILLSKNSVTPFNTQIQPIDVFYPELTKFKNLYGLHDFFFIYKGFKIQFSKFYRQYQLIYGIFWDLLDSSYLLLYGYKKESDFKKYFDTQRFYPVTQTKIPTFYLPLNWQTREIVFADNCNSTVLFQDNKPYQIFSIGKRILSSILEDTGNNVVYSTPIYCYVDGQLANKPLILPGATHIINLPPQTNWKKYCAQLLIINTFTTIDYFGFNNFNFSPTQTFNQKNNEKVQGQAFTNNLQLTYYFIIPFINRPGAEVEVTFFSNPVIIISAFLAEIPIIGNSILFNPFQVNFDSSYIQDFTSISDLLQKTNFDGFNYNYDPNTSTYSIQRTLINSDTAIFVQNNAPTGVNNNQLFFDTKYQLGITLPYLTGPFLGYKNVYNFQNNDLLSQQYYVGTPTKESMVYVQISFGRTMEYNQDSLYSGINSDLNPFIRSYINPSLDYAEYIQNNMTASTLCWPLNRPTISSLNPINNIEVLGYLGLFARRYNSNLNLGFKMSGTDIFENGLRTQSINIDHVINCKYPSKINLIFSNYPLTITNGKGKINFNLYNINNAIINKVNFITCKISVVANQTSPYDLQLPLFFHITSNLVKNTVDNIITKLPIVYCDGAQVVSLWQQTIKLNSNIEGQLDFFFDSANSFTSINFDVFLCFY